MRSASALYSPCASLSLRSLRLWLSHSRPSLSSHPNLPCARLPTSFPSASPRLHRSFAAPAKAAKKGAAGKKADAPPRTPPSPRHPPLPLPPSYAPFPSPLLSSPLCVALTRV